jgi:hypothetical protein
LVVVEEDRQRTALLVRYEMVPQLLEGGHEVKLQSNPRAFQTGLKVNGRQKLQPRPERVGCLPKRA